MAQDDQTTRIQEWINRLHEGDDSARAALLDCAGDRLTRLARKMLKGFPGVRRWEQTDDVMQNALVRLDRSLKSTRPPTAADFFRLAATQIRRELIDMARRYSGPQGLAAHHSTWAGSDRPAPVDLAPDLTHDPSRLSAWTEFHREIEALADEDRGVRSALVPRLDAERGGPGTGPLRATGQSPLDRRTAAASRRAGRPASRLISAARRSGCVRDDRRADVMVSGKGCRTSHRAGGYGGAKGTWGAKGTFLNGINLGARIDLNCTCGRFCGLRSGIL